MTSVQLAKANRVALIERMLSLGHSYDEVSAACGASIRTLKRYRKPTASEIKSKFTRSTQDQCWTWRGAMRNGYGSVNGHQAHRIVYEMEIGFIPFGHDLHHQCSNRGCVNPYHLIPLTPQEHGLVHASLSKVEVQ